MKCMMMKTKWMLKKQNNLMKNWIKCIEKEQINLFKFRRKKQKKSFKNTNKIIKCQKGVTE